MDEEASVVSRGSELVDEEASFASRGTNVAGAGTSFGSRGANVLGEETSFASRGRNAVDEETGFASCGASVVYEETSFASRGTNVVDDEAGFVSCGANVVDEETTFVSFALGPLMRGGRIVSPGPLGCYAPSMARATAGAAKIQARALRVLADDVEAGRRRLSPARSCILASEIVAPPAEAWGIEIDRRLATVNAGKAKRHDLGAVLETLRATSSALTVSPRLPLFRSGRAGLAANVDKALKGFGER